MALIFDRIDVRRKKAAVATLLACLTAWPLVHHGVTRHFRMDPWSFFGFAMYTVPRPRLSVSILAGRDGVMLPIDETPAVRAAMIRHLKRRAYWGDWLAEEGLVRELRRLRPELEDLEIVVKRQVLDPETAHLEWETLRSFHPR